MTTIIEKFNHQVHYDNNSRKHINLQLYLSETTLDIQGIDNMEYFTSNGQTYRDAKFIFAALKMVVDNKIPVNIEIDEPAMFNFTVTIEPTTKLEDWELPRFTFNCHMLNQSGF